MRILGGGRGYMQGCYFKSIGLIKIMRKEALEREGWMEEMLR